MLENTEMKEAQAASAKGGNFVTEASSAELPQSILTPQEHAIAKRLMKEPRLVSELSQELDLSKEGVFEALASLRSKGYDVFEDHTTDQVSLSREAFASQDPLAIEPVAVRNSIRFGVVCDTRMGDTSSQVSLLYDAYEIFGKRRVDFVIHAGNLTAGDRSPSRRNELFLSDSQAQRDFVVTHYPKAKFNTYVIAGPLDLSWKKKKGYNIVRDVCSAREDLIYREGEEETFRVRGNGIHVSHPGNDDTPYAKSYKPQKIAESLIGYWNSIARSGKDIPQLAFMGGWHVVDQFFGQFVQGVYVLPSFVVQNRYFKQRHIAPAIGFMIVEIFFDEENNITDVKPEYISLNKYQVDRDYLDVPSSHDLDNGHKICEEERQILELVKQGPLSPGELSRRLNKSKERVLELVTHLTECGYHISIPEDTKQVTLSIGLKEKYGPLGIAKLFGERFKIGTISDTHGGSLHQQPGLWDRAYEIFDKEEVDLVAHGGDVTDGVGAVGYRGHAKDVAIWGFDDQVRYMVRRYPRSKRKKKTKLISGNHDDWAASAFGANIVWYMCELRDDLEFIGALSGLIEHKGIRIKVLHPAGGQGYAKSYKPQRLIESDISSEILSHAEKAEGIDILLLGNWHHYHFIQYMGTYSFTLPCLKTKDDFHETRGLAPFLGIVIIEVTLAKDGGILAISPRFKNLAQFAKERDLE